MPSVFDAADERGDGPLAERVEVLPDGRERRAVVRGIRDVVEPDDADLLGYAPAALGKRADHAERHLVVGGEDGRD